MGAVDMDMFIVSCVAKKQGVGMFGMEREELKVEAAEFMFFSQFY